MLKKVFVVTIKEVVEFLKKLSPRILSTSSGRVLCFFSSSRDCGICRWGFCGFIKNLFEECENVCIGMDVNFEDRRGVPF